jgi:hypothetical protein
VRLDARWTSFGAVSRTWDRFWQGTPTAAPEPEPITGGVRRGRRAAPVAIAPDDDAVSALLLFAAMWSRT